MNPRRDVGNPASATDAGEVGSGRDNEAAIPRSVNNAGRSRRWHTAGTHRGGVDSEGSGVAAEPLEGGERLVERGHRDDRRLVAGGTLGGGDVVLALGGGDDERVDSRSGDGRRLLPQAADRADVAFEVDRAGDGHTTPPSEVAGGELVDQREREGQSGRRPTDLRVSIESLERQLDRRRVERVEADDRPLGVLGRCRQLDTSTVELGGACPSWGRRSSSRSTSPGSLLVERSGEVVDGRRSARRRWR